MGARGNLAPVIIKRKKVVGRPTHHGGAWKVAYADFVTAMMAFFLMMWLLNATTEQQRKGLADYFSPTIAVNRVSGGGEDVFSGQSILSEDVLAKNGAGSSSRHATESAQARGDSGMNATGSEFDQADAELRALEKELLGRGGESTVMKNLMKHITTRITDEGLVIELFALDGIPLFFEDGDAPMPLLRQLVDLVASVSNLVLNEIAVGGHVRARAIVLRENPVWDLSAARATRVRQMLEGDGVDSARMARVTGHADREPVVRNTMATRNDRVEIVLLRK
ncbi:flagellar motor protein MotB [Sulfitobacter sp. D35]|uniref:flagellar motor protein MotB n=1 Tax=Sulfitobacter sp. D35 TaxID=3083252 RepID=UPI00296FF6ED|nr:flagellar motor protein MotB [Sulfitobacter sp. D35]MDW4498259.1 flagellar motor protein MotB [Sulfitobacter sp. D35]